MQKPIIMVLGRNTVSGWSSKWQVVPIFTKVKLFKSIVFKGFWKMWNNCEIVKQFLFLKFQVTVKHSYSGLFGVCKYILLYILGPLRFLNNNGCDWYVYSYLHETCAL